MAAQSRLSPMAVALLADLATIRREILERAPECLPALAEVLTEAEEKVKRIGAA